MQEHTLFRTAMSRGHATRVAKELGLNSGQVPRSWKRPAAGRHNLFTGQYAPLKPGRDQLLAHDRVDHYTADILLFSLFADVAKQRAERQPDDKAAVVCALANGFRQAIEAVLSNDSPEEIEAALYIAGGCVVRAIVFVIGRAGAHVPLRSVAKRQRFVIVFLSKLIPRGLRNA